MSNDDISNRPSPTSSRRGSASPERLSAETPAGKVTESSRQVIERLLAICEKQGNCTTAMRAELWLQFGGDALDISPANFHQALAGALAQAGLTSRERTPEIAALLYCLGVTNSNNLFQKVQQGKMEPLGIGRNGRRTARSRRKS